MSIELNDETGAVNVKSNLPADGDVVVIIAQLKNLSEGLIFKVKQKVDRDYPDINFDEKVQVLKSLTIKDLK